MYLQKAPNGVYQTRICIPRALRESGYPFDIKVSLLTKERSEAIERNFKVASCIKVAINQVDMVNPVLFPKFKLVLNQQIEVLRKSFSSPAAYKPSLEAIAYFEDDIVSDLPNNIDLSNLETTEPSVKSIPSKVVPFAQLLCETKNCLEQSTLIADHSLLYPISRAASGEISVTTKQQI